MIVNGAFDKNQNYINGNNFDYDNSERSSPRFYADYDIARLTPKQKQILCLATLFQMTSVGAPMIYYGTEVGMIGADDPDDRMPMLWQDIDYENQTKGPRGKRAPGNKLTKVDSKMLEYFRSVIALRNNHPALRRGSFKILGTHDHHQLIAFTRKLGEDQLIVLLNRSPSTRTMKIALGEGSLPSNGKLQPIFASNSKPETLRSKKTADAWILGISARTGGVWRVISE